MKITINHIANNMDSLNLVLAFCCTCAFIYTFTFNILGRKSLPPGPRPLPVIGNILDLGEKPHQILAKLSKRYGNLMSLKLGTLTTIVISSPNMAKEALHKHDQALSSRTVPNSVHIGNHHNLSMVWMPVNNRWRNLRKISTTQLFTSRRLNAGQDLRSKKVQELVNFVSENCKIGKAVDIGQAAFTTVLNLMSNTFFSIDLANYNSKKSQEFIKTIVTLMEVAGKPNIADYFPILGLVDPQGTLRHCKIYFERLMKVFDGIIDKRMKSRMTQEEQNHDVLDSLLILVQQSDSELSLEDVKHLLLDFFLAGTDTTTTSLVWAMAELLKNPEKMAKIKNEVKQIDVVEESDIMNLPYLQATIKETFRLHPPVPFLLPHKAESEVEINGFKVPKNAQILVNVWAMGRDAGIWENPEKFEPERFLDSKIDVKGRDFELIPFGAGRRMCPGLPLAHKMLHLMLASLIHSFNWKLPNDMKPIDLDMSETSGIALHKTKPLLAAPHY
uniref:Cytochrome p450 n=1 Tax=Croton stellatopilosus TaxID=431156 RepID=A0A3G2CJV5_9ROSI|nr:cytochrome p450 [Croton stellatopilosus]